MVELMEKSLVWSLIEGLWKSNIKDPIDLIPVFRLSDSSYIDSLLLHDSFLRNPSLQSDKMFKFSRWVMMVLIRMFSIILQVMEVSDTGW